MTNTFDRDSLLERAPDSLSKGSEFESRQEPGGGDAEGGRFSSLELTLCADSYSVSVPSPCYNSGT